MQRHSAKERDLPLRTKEYALRIIRLYIALPKNEVARVLGKQLLRSGTSVGAHYAEANHAKSNKDFISKIEGGLQELNESRYWLELLRDSETVKAERLQPLIDETGELISIFVKMTSVVKRRNATE
jgi:four helix bundle protein